MTRDLSEIEIAIDMVADANKRVLQELSYLQDNFVILDDEVKTMRVNLQTMEGQLAGILDMVKEIVENGRSHGE